MSTPFLDEILAAYPTCSPAAAPALSITGTGALPSWFDVTGLASASIGAAGLMLARLATQQGEAAPAVSVDRRLASYWFAITVRPIGWEMPPAWDPIAGDYRAKDRWIRLHTNAPHHRAAALSVLGDHYDRAGLEPAVAKWAAHDLEQAVVEAGGCAAVMHDLDEWARHPQGIAIASDPLAGWRRYRNQESRWQGGSAERPLAGLKVLDLTRVLAGPVAGRFLAAYGAEVLRIDPPDWEEAAIVPEVTLGKRCARLDLKSADGRAAFIKLLTEADILLHGYRRDALERLGFSGEEMRRINPGLIDISHNAYGWSGPWTGRRGFDSLVQMSGGIADCGMRMAKAEKPTPLPVQALDMATGYLLAAAALHALAESRDNGAVLSAKLSLAKVAHLLTASKRGDLGEGIAAETATDLDPHIEETAWGQARRPYWPLTVAGVPARWPHPAQDLGWSEASWG